MEYYLDDGLWDIRIFISDTGSGSVTYTSSSAFEFLLVKDITISPTTIGFPSVTPGSTTPVTSNLVVGQIYSTQITNRGNSAIFAALNIAKKVNNKNSACFRVFQ